MAYVEPQRYNCSLQIRNLGMLIAFNCVQNIDVLGLPTVSLSSEVLAEEGRKERRNWKLAKTLTPGPGHTWSQWLGRYIIGDFNTLSFKNVNKLCQPAHHLFSFGWYLQPILDFFFVCFEEPVFLSCAFLLFFLLLTTQLKAKHIF